ncbi:UDP-N-acetylglucosamine 2-epimerase [Anaerosolibacter sp.]|uniref:UDP-N-acetylglucosamine 2-epimerase n=1 Tax=Anaerosolibacter sp. TaxID=1872527 RepID=UPI0039F02234
MRNIAVVTGTRAEYGLLYHTIKRINEDDKLNLQLIVTGTHLVKQYGNTVDSILHDGFSISDQVDIIMASGTKASIAKSTGLAVNEFSKAYERLATDMILILGDRYEIFAAAAAAMIMNIPIAHISGGEVTEGAQDEQIRHAITKMSHLHFPGAEAYARNIINMGEEPWRVFNVGDPGIENIKHMDFLNQEEIQRELGITVDSETLLVTFHPVTLELDQLPYQIQNLIEALEESGKKIVLTYPNADTGSEQIIEQILMFSERDKNVAVFKNLGSQRYLSIMRLCGAVVGNSSSAIVEAPYLKVPAIDIGDRQKGRLKSDSIIQCGHDKQEIAQAIRDALSVEFRAKIQTSNSLYGEGSTSTEIIRALKSIEIDERLLKKKLVWS